MTTADFYLTERILKWIIFIYFVIGAITAAALGLHSIRLSDCTLFAKSIMLITLIIFSNS